MLADDERLKEERRTAKKTRDKFQGIGNSEFGGVSPRGPAFFAFLLFCLTIPRFLSAHSCCLLVAQGFSNFGGAGEGSGSRQGTRFREEFDAEFQR